MADNDKEKIIKEIDKNSLERIVVSLRNYRDKNLIDIRTYFQNDEGKWKPTRKGISLDTGHYNDLKSGILLLGEEISKF